MGMDWRRGRARAESVSGNRRKEREKSMRRNRKRKQRNREESWYAALKREKIRGSERCYTASDIAIVGGMPLLLRIQ